MSTKTISPIDFATKFLGRILEKLKLKKPVITPVSATDEVWLMDSTAFFNTATNTWSSEIMAAYFHRDGGQEIADMVAEIAALLKMADNDAAKQTVANRIEPFINAIQAAKTVQVGLDIGEPGTRFSTREAEEKAKKVVTLGPSQDRGISLDEVAFPGGRDVYPDGVAVKSMGLLPSGSLAAQMTTHFASQDGWGIISDVDDTIKVSEVRDRIKLLRHTFVDDQTAVPGMVELYHQLNDLLNPVWFYLSASPYNLYPVIRKFLLDHFPLGQLVLRDMSWMELESFIVSLTVGTEGYKIDRMDRMHRWFPNRKMICIGDSTQKDPEAYAAVYKKYPGWIKKIYIRVVKGVNEREEKDLNSKARFEKAFKGIPKDAWVTFEDPREVSQQLGVLIEEVGQAWEDARNIDRTSGLVGKGLMKRVGTWMPPSEVPKEKKGEKEGKVEITLQKL